MSPAVFLIIAIIAIGLLLLISIVLRGNRRHLNVEYYQAHWLKIENGFSRHNPSSYVTSVLAADKLVDRALEELGVAGKTMGERLKHSGTRFSRLNDLWYAHKIRNQLAHEPDADVNYETASRALVIFKQALKDLGAI